MKNYYAFLKDLPLIQYDPAKSGQDVIYELIYLLEVLKDNQNTFSNNMDTLYKNLTEQHKQINQKLDELLSLIEDPTFNNNFLQEMSDFTISINTLIEQYNNSIDNIKQGYSNDISGKKATFDSFVSTTMKTILDNVNTGKTNITGQLTTNETNLTNSINQQYEAILDKINNFIPNYLNSDEFKIQTENQLEAHFDSKEPTYKENIFNILNYYQEDEPTTPSENELWLKPSTKLCSIYKEGAWITNLNKFGQLYKFEDKIFMGDIKESGTTLINLDTTKFSKNPNYSLVGSKIYIDQKDLNMAIFNLENKTIVYDNVITVNGVNYNDWLHPFMFNNKYYYFEYSFQKTSTFNKLFVSEDGLNFTDSEITFPELPSQRYAGIITNYNNELFYQISGNQLANPGNLQYYDYATYKLDLENKTCTQIPCGIFSYFNNYYIIKKYGEFQLKYTSDYNSAEATVIEGTNVNTYDTVWLNPYIFDDYVFVQRVCIGKDMKDHEFYSLNRTTGIVNSSSVETRRSNRLVNINGSKSILANNVPPSSISNPNSHLFFSYDFDNFRIYQIYKEINYDSLYKGLTKGEHCYVISNSVETINDCVVTPILTQIYQGVNNE